jgi:hypothetical protein
MSSRARSLADLITTPISEYATDNELNSALESYVNKNIVDAKGDLLAGTADNTAGRLAVGTNGQVLVADSGETTGLKWNDPGTVGGLVHIETQSPSAVTSVSFTSKLSADFNNYLLVSYLIAPTNGSGVFLRVRSGTTDNDNNDYYFQTLTGNNTTVTAARTQTTFFSHSTTSTTSPRFSYIELFSPFLAEKTLYRQTNGQGNLTIDVRSGILEDTVSYDGLSVLSAQNFTGTISLYGFRK